MANYSGRQKQYHSKSNFSVDFLNKNGVSVFDYSQPALLKIMSDENQLAGEQRILGTTEKKGNGSYETVIIANWYHTGTQNNPYDPSIEFTLSYIFENKNAPSHLGWFDDETIKQTGFTAEQFMLIWKATLSSFHRNR